MSRTILNDAAERSNFFRVVNTFQTYRLYSLERISHNEEYLGRLPEKHQILLKSYKNHLQEAKECIDKNDELVQLIIKDVFEIFDSKEKVDSREMKNTPDLLPSQSDIDRVNSTIKQIVRDWSSVGSRERELCYQPIIDEIMLHFPPDRCTSEDVNVLVPGAGLGRLAFDIANHGYSCQGNEYSLFMLFTSYFVINKCDRTNLFTIYPWVHQPENTVRNSDHLTSVTFPDVNPQELLKKNSLFSMTAGDFLEVYKNSNEWDCVATCFFIDCAHNIVDFIEAIYKILKPGGLWINLGPLLYHFSEMEGQDSIELSYEEIKKIILDIGFILEKEKTQMTTTYGQIPHSMMQFQYESIFFVCRKPLGEVSNGNSDANHVHLGPPSSPPEQDKGTP